MAASNFRNVDRGGYGRGRGGRGGRDGDGDRYRHRRPYHSLWWPTYSYYGYPFIWPGFPTILDCDDPDDNLGCGYGYGGYGDNGYGNYGYENGPDNGGADNGNYGMLGADQGYDEQNLGSWPSTPPQYQQPAAGQPYSQSALSPSYAPPSSEDAVTLIFKDGRASEQIHNYVLTPTILYAGDIAHRQVIPLDQLDIPATEKVNQDNGVDFHVPQLEVRTVPNPGLPDTHVINPQ
jgi:hypothetical protein